MEINILELLCFMDEDKQPSECIELQEMFTKLNKYFQIENINTKFKPEWFHSDRKDDSVLTVADTVDAGIECDSVVDLLWESYQDTLLQSNWCNAVHDVTKITTVV